MEQEQGVDIMLPSAKKQVWAGQFLGKFSGEFSQSWNIDLERSEGKVVTAERFVMSTDSVTLSNMTTPQHFILTDADGTAAGKWWGLTSHDMIVSANANATSAFSLSGNHYNNDPYHDMIVSGTNNGNDRLLMTVADDISILNCSGHNNAFVGTWWGGILGKSALDTTNTHYLARLESVNVVIVCDGQYAHTIDNSDVVSRQRLHCPQDYKITGTMTSLNRAWFLLTHKFSGKGIIADWDGSATNFNDYFYVDGAPIIGTVSNDNVPYVVLDNGTLLEYNGSGFAPVQYFPNFEEKLQLDVPTSQHCATSEGSILYFLIKSPFSSARMRSGVWAFDTKNKNLYHRYGISLTKAADSVSSDYGQEYINIAGCIVKVLGISSSTRFLLGANIYTDYPYGFKSVVEYLYERETRAYITTPLLPASAVENYWYALWLRYRKFITPTSTIVTKYRVSEGLLNTSADPLRATVTWPGTGAQTVTGTVPSGVVYGNEMEILSGPNAGCSFTIASINSGLILIDEVPPNVTATTGSLVQFDDWVKISNNNPITATSPGSVREQVQLLGAAGVSQGPYIQFKIELRGFRVELDQLRAIGHVEVTTDLK